MGNKNFHKRALVLGMVISIIVVIAYNLLKPFNIDTSTSLGSIQLALSFISFSYIMGLFILFTNFIILHFMKIKRYNNRSDKK